jgi:endonuclease/exonuclease/phosphatase (EEP) superfamily protein YafD
MTTPDPSPKPESQQEDSPTEATAPLWRRLLWPAWEDRKRMLYRQAWVMVTLAWIGVIFCYAMPQDFRATSSAYVAIAWFAFLIRAGIFHLGLPLAVVAVTAGARRSWKLLAVSAPLLLITVAPELWEYRPRSRPEARAPAFTVMSANLLMINRNTAPIIEQIRAQKPDVLLLQEYTAHWHTALQEAFAKDLPHSICFPREDSFGAAVYSRRPLENKAGGYLRLGHGDVPQIRVVTGLGGRRVALYNVHLLPPRRFDYTKRHRWQFADLLEKLEAEKLPVILGGDFNFTPRTPNAARLRSLGMIDAHCQGGWGRGATWPVNGALRWLPGVRLDQVWLGNGLVCTECRRGTHHGSDHLAVLAKIRFSTMTPHPEKIETAQERKK